jgi:hypothetical protein
LDTFSRKRKWLMSQQEVGDWTHLLCDRSNAPSNGPIYFFGYWYYLSKYYELLDTIIMVLRKRPMTVLHLYHHSVVVLLTFLWLYTDYTLFWWTVWLNTSVHIVMYTYFFVISLGIRVPNSWKVSSTAIDTGG